jgi:hypothetical protein
MPADIRHRWEQSVAAANPSEIDALRAKSAAAAAEDNFSGFVRRCIHRGGRPVSRLADAAGVDLLRLGAFLHGDGLLDSDELDRLLQTLGMELMGVATLRATGDRE